MLARGDQFTWCNMQKEKDLILPRLDRYVCFVDWHAQFPSTKAKNLGFFGSNHRPISLHLSSEVSPILKNLPKRFTFDHKWFMEEDFKDILSNC